MAKRKIDITKPNTVEKHETAETADVNENIVVEEVSVPEEMVSKSAYDELYNKYLFKCAEFDNYMKRTNAQMQKQREMQDQHLLTVLIPALNNIYAGMRIANDDGPRLMFKAISDAFKTADIEIIIPAVGETFNADAMMAISTAPAPDETADNTVVDVIAPGYTIKGTYVEYPKVVVYQA